jgi:hypothetical protein
MAAGAALLLWLSPSTSLAWLTLALVVLGAGLGLVNPPITNTGVSGMPPSQAGVASAVISATRQFGGVRVRVAAGESHADALSAATHAPWLLAVVCGALVAVVGLITTSARALAAAHVD